MRATLADRLYPAREAIGDIDRIIEGKSFETFATDEMLCAATERLLEIVTLACRHVPDDIKAREPGIAWQRIDDLREKLLPATHIAPDLLWQFVKNDLGPLRDFVEKIIREEDTAQA